MPPRDADLLRESCALRNKCRSLLEITLISRNRAEGPDRLREPPGVAVTFVERLALTDQGASTLEVAAEHSVDGQSMQQDCPTVRVAELVEDRKAPPVQLEREIPIASDVRGAGVRAQCLSLTCRVGVSVEIEHGSMSPNALVWVVDYPELLHGDEQTERPLEIPALARPLERTPDVVLVCNRQVETLSPEAEPPGVQVRTFGELEEVIGVRIAHQRRLVCSLELVECELANGFEHDEATAATAKQALVNERLDEVRVRPGDRLDRIQRRTAAKHRERAKVPRLVCIEELVAPGDCGVERALAIGDVASSRNEDRQSAFEPRKEHLGLEHPRAGRRELDRERQAVESEADLRGERVLDGDVGRDRSRSVPKELDRRCLREGIEGVLLLVRDAERLTTCRQHLHVGTRAKQKRQITSGRDDLLEIVDHK